MFYADGVPRQRLAVKFDSIFMNISHFSKKNPQKDKPNEDAFAVGLNKYCMVIADGVSRLRLDDGSYPEADLSGKAARLVSSKIAEELDRELEKTQVRESLFQAIANANRALQQFNAENVPHPDYSLNDLAATALVAAYIEGQTLYLGQIGDCLCFTLQEDGSLREHLENQTKKIECYIRSEGSSRELQSRIRREIRNNKSHDLAWGALTGEEKALDFVQFASVSISETKKVFLLSDGVLSAFELSKDLIETGSAKEIIEELARKEQDSGIIGDDKTLIVIEVKET